MAPPTWRGMFALTYVYDSNLEADADACVSIHELAYEGSVEALRDTLSCHPERLEELDDQGRSVLSVAAGGGCVDAVNMLLLLGASVESADVCQRTALYWACANNKLDAAKALINHGAEIIMKVLITTNKYMCLFVLTVLKSRMAIRQFQS